ncbi:MAG: MarR family winged helix-turn-helix transcriptional regulator [Alphaproteobacteria bacterium]|nr:MarR family transcriptional regulator [Alphaproteobacteria bacterium]
MPHSVSKPSESPAGDLFELQREVGWLVYDASRLLMRSVESKVREAGVTSQQWRVLVQLARENGQTQSRLAEEAEIAPAPLGRLLDRLEDQKIIERRPDPTDRRAKRIYLVGGEQGPFFERLRELAMQQFATVYKSVNHADLLELQRLLLKLKSNMFEGGTEHSSRTD